MLLGMWKNVEELEINLTLDELEAILDASREKEMRDRKFFAALKGIDLEGQDNSAAKEKVEEMKRKVEALQDNNMSEEEYDFADLGLDFEEEE